MAENNEASSIFKLLIIITKIFVYYC